MSMRILSGRQKSGGMGKDRDGYLGKVVPEYAQSHFIQKHSMVTTRGQNNIINKYGEDWDMVERD